MRPRRHARARGGGNRAPRGPRPAAALFAGLDADALAAVGVDPGAVRDQIEASFGPDALARAGHAVQRKPRLPSGLHPKNPRPMRTGPVSRWRLRRQARHTEPLPPVPPPPPGRYQAPGPRLAGGIPATPDAWYAIRRSGVEAMLLDQHTRIGAEHLALAVTAMTAGLVPPILSALGTSAPELRTAILEHSRQPT